MNVSEQPLKLPEIFNVTIPQPGASVNITFQ